jgi:hypothetical protein
MTYKYSYRHVDDGGPLDVSSESLNDSKVDPAMTFHQYYKETFWDSNAYAIMLEVSPRPSSPMTCTKLSNNQRNTTGEVLTLTAMILLFFATPKLFDAAIPAT